MPTSYYNGGSRLKAFNVLKLKGFLAKQTKHTFVKIQQFEGFLTNKAHTNMDKHV